MNTKAIFKLLAEETDFSVSSLKTIFYSIKVNHKLFVPVNDLEDLEEFGYQGTLTIEFQYHPFYTEKVTVFKEALNKKLYDHAFFFKEILESQSDPAGVLKSISHIYQEKLVLTFNIED